MKYGNFRNYKSDNYEFPNYKHPIREESNKILKFVHFQRKRSEVVLESRFFKIVLALSVKIGFCFSYLKNRKIDKIQLKYLRTFELIKFR